jgi:hypothetical protein
MNVMMIGSNLICRKHGEDLLKEFGVLDNPDTEFYPSMFDLFNKLEKLFMPKNFSESEFIYRAKHRVEGAVRALGQAFNCSKGFDFAQMICDHHLVIDIFSLNYYYQNYLIVIIIFQIYYTRLCQKNLNPTTSFEPLTVVVDEAIGPFNIKAEEGLADIPNIISDIILTARELNITFIWVTNRISQVMRTLIAESHTKIGFAVGDPFDRKIVLDCMGIMGEEAQKFYSIMPKQFVAIASTKESPNPVLIETPKPFVNKNITDTMVDEAMSSWIASIPWTKAKEITTETKPDRLFDLLMEIYNHPDKHQQEILIGLNLSIRIVTFAIKNGYIISHKIHPGTRAGVFQIFELTQKGLKYISKEKNTKLYNRGSDFEHGYWTNHIAGEIKQISSDYNCFIDKEILGVYPDIGVIKNEEFYNIQVVISSALSQEKINIEKALFAHTPGFKTIYMACQKDRKAQLIEMIEKNFSMEYKAGRILCCLLHEVKTFF